jgi:S-DNA-T family DNA segregation ATPase FtsK/SpoIIIE
MIIERDRVAVSLFQREFEMDFKEATALLDELQERGLIGPYLGGRHRDILLTREEWLAKVAAS